MSERNGLEIAIVGLAGRFPGARSLEELWENLRGGVESIQRFSDEELAAAGVPRELLVDPRYVKAGTVIEGADLLDAEFFGLTPREAEIIDPQHRLFLECAWEALEAAGYDPETYRRPIGVYAGVSFSSYVLLNVWSNRDRIDFLGSLLGSDKDHLSTLVSYKLNLEGPSLAVQTACSTSLVAVHLAAQSLLNGECDMALAGGSSLRFPQRTGYVWTEGGMVSEDGHCRAFDAAGSGTVFGDGLGIVVLKRLEDAEADGDTIHAVIKGSAVNNDGAARVAYTAPRMEGQAKVIRAAQTMAEVEPDSIGFVEAHGTATPLGDPIEFAALTEAFRAGTSRRSFCALGSVKTNIGHLNAAAGIAGLIKAVLALENKMIPPTLHFERPNPQIDLAASPFYVNTEPVPWQAGEKPRRAGVHAFGMGGTNAHVILEEAPEAPPSGPSRAWQMLFLSARTPAALEAATDRLAAHLAAHPEVSLADAAFTLHLGRRAFANRRVVLAASREQAVRALAARDPERVVTASEVDRERPVFFAFASDGALSPAAFRALYDAEPSFRQEVDHCGEVVGRPAAGSPPLFVVEYALARLWLAWGVRPQGMLGHGVGELVAACLAGVFSLPGALRLAAVYGRLLGEIPAGVPLPAAALAAATDAFAEALAGIELKAPSLPFVSRETGRWITGADATDPEYWVKSLATNALAADGFALLPADGVLLDVGPEADQEGLVRSLGALWLAGVRLDGRAYYAGEKRRRLTLPSYPFERRRYWIEPWPEARVQDDRAAVPLPAWGEVGGPELHRTFHPRPQNLRTAYVPPVGPVESAIAGIWRDLFGIAEIGSGDDFYVLGGHSLLITRMASRVREALGVELPLRIFFEERTIARLAAVIKARAGEGGELQEAPVLVRGPRPRDLPLSFSQQRLWLLDQLAPGNPFYNLPGAVRIEGELRIDALAAALRELVCRHETLRTGFGSEGGRPVQRIEADVSFKLPFVDLSALPAEEREDRVRRLIAELSRRAFDLSHPPLLRVNLLRLGMAEHVLLFCIHHIVSDGWSQGVLVTEVARLYVAFVKGEPSPLPELPVQYADFALWQRRWLQGEVLESQLAYWRERLAGAPVTELPTDRPRPAVQSFRGATCSMKFPAEGSAAVAAFAREHGASLFMVLLGAFQVLVHRYTGLEDVVVGTPIANRTRRELEGLIGFFINSLVMRTDLAGDPGATELLARVRETALGSYSHQDLPFEYLVEKLQPQRDLSRNPLFQLMFNLLDAPARGVEPEGLRLTRLNLEAEISLFDLQVYVRDTGDGLATVWEYSTDLFDAATIERLAGHYKVVLQGLVSHPDTRLSELPLLTALEQRQLLVDWNATRRTMPGRCVQEGIAAQAARTPEAVAVVCGGESLTYGELDRRANALAHHLRRLGVGPEVRVGIALERSLDMVVSLLAVLKAGGAYVPLDPFYPAERLAFMQEDAGLKVLLSRETLPAAVKSAEPPESGVGLQNLAYVIYTSGSTGRPKGVQISHGALTNFLAAMAETLSPASADTLLAITSLSFDIAGLDVYLPLLVGGRVVLASREDAIDGCRLQALIAESGATMLQATPATWRLLLESGWQGEESLKALSGGEALSPVLAASLLPRVASLWNLYGPTETTIYSTIQEIIGTGSVLIGGPLANTEAYVVDRRGNPTPVGVPGELLLGGAGVARGYLGRPDLTAEKFVPNPFGEVGSRLYRTGDLARFRVDGRLDYLGRLDHQVKLRGFRIELGEIEAALVRHAAVAAAVVVARDEASGDRRLVAYWVPRRQAGQLPVSELRDWLRRSLPEYMVPAAWVELAELPLTPNGKVDRKSLPAPEVIAVEAAFTAPRTPVEEVLARIWAPVLGVDAVGAGDSFFDLGGHSLLATQVVARVREAFGVELPLRALFEKPVLAGLAAEIESLQSWERGFTIPPLRPVPREGNLPLSFAQERLWFLDQLQPGSSAYNVPAAVRLSGRLDVAALAATLQEIVRRHESLRTSFAVMDGRPVQRVAPASDLPLPQVDLGELTPDRKEAAVRALAAGEAQQPFDLTRALKLRALLIRLGPEEHALLLTLHHIAADGWSAGVLVREMVMIYRAFTQGEPSPLAELPVQYADFAVWQRGWLQGGALEAQLAYWRGALAGAPVLQLATDRPRTPLQSYRGADLSFRIPGEGVRSLSQKLLATPFMVLLAGFEALLQRYTGQSDVIVGSTIANRTRSELERLIGFFVNTLALRADLGGDPAFGTLLTQVRESALGAYAHQDLPFEKLVSELQPERDLSRSPLFQVLFQLQNVPMGAEPIELQGLELRPLGVGGQTAKFDLVLNTFETELVFTGVLKYNTDLFEQATAERLVRHFTTLVTGAVAKPSLRLSELPLLSAEEHDQLAHAWNEAPAEDLGASVLHARFSEQAARAPEATAVVCNGERLSYGELETRSNQLARYLMRLGVTPGDRVGLSLERSAGMVVAILGVLKAGAAYVPLDPSYPPERLAFLVADSRPSVVLTAESLAEDAERISRERASAPSVPVSAAHPAYVIYTSGSTGQPKGVVVRHGNAMRLFTATDRWFGFGPEDVWTLFHSYAFDFSVWEIWGALLYGGRLVIVPYWVSRSPEAFYGLLRAERVTVLNQTPSAFRQLLWAEEAVLGEAAPDLALRYVIFGGEALEPASLAPWFERHGDEHPRLVNMYGITETTVHVTYREVVRADVARAVSAVGQPIPDLGVYLLDSALQPVPLGVPGEIHVGGAGLAEGYLGRPELTAERFVPNPFGEAGARLYKSGDLARRLLDGDLEYLGRIDHQVKIRGFRIELGEIESALVRHPAVREAVVLAVEDAQQVGDRRLIAWIVPVVGEVLVLSDLRAFAGASLPDYMLPSALVLLDSLPLTAHGKIDRRALPASEAQRTDEVGFVAARTPLEAFVADLWQEVLKAERVGIHDDFFELGGNSISGAVLINRLQQELSEIVQVVVIFDYPTVASLAGYLADQHPVAVVARLGADAAGRPLDASDRSERIDAPKLSRFRGLIQPLAPAPTPTRKNRRAVFVLSPPRSGSTLLRVMLGGHPQLFAPPELELLSFNTLRERSEAFSGRDSFWLEGAIRAVMEVRGCGPEEAREILERFERENLTTSDLYNRLQEWLGDRILVDKTPSYALDPSILERAEEIFEEPLYIHLIRHPGGMIRSFVEAKLDQIFFRREHGFSRRELAELIWLASHQNIGEFLQGIPADRQHWVCFEDLLREPETTLQSLCEFLGLAYDPAMAEPYQQSSARMTDGPHAESRMLGDVKFHEHSGVDAAVAERWRETVPESSLGDSTRTLAAQLGYEIAPEEAVWQPIERGSWREGEPLPLSFAQERLWFLDQLEPGSSAYNIPIALRLTGALDAAALGQVLGEILSRHAVLRTRFVQSGGLPAQVVDTAEGLELPVVDLQGLPSDLGQAEAVRLAVEEEGRAFDLTRSPLLRALLMRLGDEEHVIVLNQHHIASDGWSLGVLVHEVATLYPAFVAGQSSPLPELSLQYVDYALWQRGWLQGEVLEREISYWRRRLDGAAPLELPTDRPRPAVQTSQGARTPFFVPQDLARSAALLGRGQGATLFMALLAAFAALLQRTANQDDLAIGTPVAGRNRAELEGLIGFFVNTLVLRVDGSGDPSFRALLARVRETTLGAFAHQSLPFEKVVEELQPQRDLSRSPLFQVMFTLRNAVRDAIELPGLELRGFSSGTTTAKFDLTFSLSDSGEGLAGGIEFNLDLFDAATIDRLAQRFGILLAGIVNSPDQPLSELPLLAEDEWQQVVLDWNATATSYPREATLAGLFRAQVARYPQAVALDFAEEAITYRELGERSARLAGELRSLGVRRGSRVGLCFDRSPDLIVSLLAVIEAGAAYVPLDPSYPAERLGWMLEDSGISVVVTRRAAATALPDLAITTLLLDRDAAKLAEHGLEPAVIETCADDLAYVMYTSGSTGRPKGTAIPHRAIVRLLFETDYVALGPGERIAHVSNVSFDAATFEIWGALLHGGTVVGIEREVTLSPQAFTAEIKRRGVTSLFVTTALFNQLAREAPEGLAGLRNLLFGGEACDPRLVREVLEKGAPERLLHVYGPTESTTFATWQQVITVPASASTVPVGRPLANTTAFVLDRGLRPAPTGVPGELLLGGDGLAQGYWRRPELTAERFVPSPWGPAGSRLYRTGDLVRWLPGGMLEFLGRIDQQVKLRGFRIEPGEIEAVLASHPTVLAAVVKVWEPSPGDRRLAAWIVGKGGAAPDGRELRAFLEDRLPVYMVPSAFVALAELPLTPNGKVDRQALPAPGAADVGAIPSRAPATPEEELLAGIWSSVLHLDAVGAEDDFFALGGHSLLATQVVSRVRGLFGVELPLRSLFEQPTVAGLAGEIVVLQARERELEAPPLERAPRSGGLPLSFAQERLWFLDQLQPGSSAYNMPIPLRLSGALDVLALRRVLTEVMRRHEVLRTRFVQSGGSPVQVVDPPPFVPLPVIDLQGLPSEEARSEALCLVAAEGKRGFDLARGPLLRSLLMRLGAGEHVIVLNQHHIASDGWSLEVLVREVAALYPAFVAGEASPLPELAIQYADFAVWQREWLRGEVLAREISYWHQSLSGLEPLELPTDRPRPPVQTSRGANRNFSVSEELAASLARLGRGQGATLFMAGLAVFAALLQRTADQDDIAIGTPVAGRNRAELEGMIGFFVNTLVLRVDGSGELGFEELLDRVRETALGAYTHQDLPFEKVVEELQPQRDLSRSPLFQVMFALDTAPREAPLSLPGLTLERLPLGGTTAKFDLSFSLFDTGAGLAGSIELNVDLFDPSTIDRLARRFEILLAGIAAGPERPVSELPLLDAGEAAQIESWSRSGEAAYAPACLHELFEAQVDLDPEVLAAVVEGESLSYGELESRANRLARHLRHLGVGPEVAVGLSELRSLEGLVCLLAILKAGGVYVPVDPAHPRERQTWMLADCGAQVLLTRESLGSEAVARQSAERLVGLASPEHLAYVIYTSGSTGAPKGVGVSHQAAASHLRTIAGGYGLEKGDRLLQTASWSFDASLDQLLGPLFAGATVVLWEGDLDVAELPRRLSTLAVTVADLPPAFLQLWARETAGSGASPDLQVRLVMTGGEALPPEVARLWPSTPLGKAQLLNGYGPTEAVITVSLYPVAAGASLPAVPIGRPLAGREARVLDRHGNPVPPGVPGELALGGLLARGYLGRPEVTAERFVPDAFGSEAGARLYRTGDRVRWLPAGDLDFLGRIDQQVKVRGFRIEPGEIEAALAGHPAVAQAAVVVTGEGVARRLVGFLVAKEETPVPGTAELRAFLVGTLPEYMVPSLFIGIAALPLTPSGKVDRRTLTGLVPAPEAGAGSAVPSTPVEQILAGIWAEVLHLAAVGAEDDFFALGGHSLLATQVVSRAREAFGVDLPLRSLFEKPTVAALATEIGALKGRVMGFHVPPLRPVPREGDLPLSFAQERLWFLDQLQPGSAAYNVPAAVRLEGRLDVSALRAALWEIVRRHESLRTSFAVQSGRPVQRITPAVDLEIPVVDLGSLEPGSRETEARALAAAEALRPFDLRETPLLRAVLIRLTGEEHGLFLSLHHIASDGWSTGVLVRELVILYRAFSQGEPSPLPELPVQYADFAVWQRGWLQGEVLEAQLAYWRELLSGAPVLQLATDRPRTALQSYRGADSPFLLAEAAGVAVRALARERGATAYMVLLAGFDALLQRYTGQDDLVVGSVIANRTHSELEGLIGFFVNTLALRGDLSGEPSFRDLLVRTRESALGAYAHQDLPFEKLVAELQPERDLSRSPLFQVLFQLHNAPLDAEPIELPGLELQPMGAGGQTARFDLVLNAFERGSSFNGVLKYNTDLFEKATAARIVRHFTALVAGAVAEPAWRLSGLPLLSAAESHQIGREWSEAPVEDLGSGVLHERFAEQAARTPEATAVVCDGERLSYGELETRSNQLARYLVGLGAQPGGLVGLRLERSVEMAVAILGVLKAGAAYLPLDPSYPPERLAFLVADSRPSIVLTKESLAENAERISREPGGTPYVPVSAEHPAYVIYTSGSTGRPKGVVVRHGNVLRLFSATQRWFSFGPEDVWTLFHSYAFDFSVWEIWGALLYGGRLVIVPYWVSRSPEAFYELLRAEKVTVLNQTPSAFRQLIWAEESILGGVAPELALRYVIFGGEALEPASLAPWFERHGDERPRLINMYGITETTVHVTYREVGRADVNRAVSAVGCPIPDLGVYLLDSTFQPVPLGVPGEVYVGGAGLAEGYLGRPELTAERFVPNPFGEPGSRLYKSGDLARRLPDGDIEYLGRIDHQVKIRGFRIELGEIESALVRHPSVREAVVLAVEDTERTGDRRLVAWAVPVAGETPTLSELRAFAGASLPDYMLPSAVVLLEALPLTANGKVDRRALPAPDAVRLEDAVFTVPRTPLEAFVADLWQEVLKVERVGVHDDFFELGGNSISGAVLINRLQQELSEIVQVVVIFDHSTVEALARYLADQHPAAVVARLGADAAGRPLEAVDRSERIDAPKLVRFRELIQPLAPRPAPAQKNRRAVFVLSPPRSGSTLLRVMLGGHPQLFAPPELELLSFNTLQERSAAFSGRDSFWLEGALRAVMEIRGCGPEEAREILEGFDRENLTTAELYGHLQEWLGERILVDKTPSYALDPAILRRAEESFEEPLYIHLIRHPGGMVRSFVEAKLDQIFFRRAHGFSRRELAELIWLASHQNVEEFLREIPANRQHWVRFEDLLREPETTLQSLCEFLGLAYDPAMAEPYQQSSARMTDGPHAESRMLGDVKFHEHSGVDASVADRWREAV
ncbi:MAG TPA: non-ribosomal peptide synthase/polyketide synthase, partial [Thermoanaerobaculia bacterium]|nr:non-ribosomal peptide synthase/polyketide synthase [Thermoanaerobaculia bacterium]